MSAEALQQASERWSVDPQFESDLSRDFEQAMSQYGYSLTGEEIPVAKSLFSIRPRAVGNMPPPAVIGAPAIPPQFQPPTGNLLETVRKIHVERLADLSKFNVTILKETLNNAADTYKQITWMNTVMFRMGAVLFLVAAVYGLFSKDLKVMGAFAGLGAASFVALFLLGPIDKTQDALSNLIQAEIAFMNYFEQLGILETLAQLPSPGTGIPSVANLEEASARLQQRSEETIALLQKYVETVKKQKERSRTQAAANRAAA